APFFGRRSWARSRPRWKHCKSRPRGSLVWPEDAPSGLPLASKAFVPTLAVLHSDFEQRATESLATPAPAEIRRDQHPPKEHRQLQCLFVGGRSEPGRPGRCPWSRNLGRAEGSRS